MKSSGSLEAKLRTVVWGRGQRNENIHSWNLERIFFYCFPCLMVFSKKTAMFPICWLPALLTISPLFVFMKLIVRNKTPSNLTLRSRPPTLWVRRFTACKYFVTLWHNLIIWDRDLTEYPLYRESVLYSLTIMTWTVTAEYVYHSYLQ